MGRRFEFLAMAAGETYRRAASDIHPVVFGIWDGPTELWIAVPWFAWLSSIRYMEARRLLGTFLVLCGLSIWLLLGYGLHDLGISASVLTTTAIGVPFVLTGSWFTITGGHDEERSVPPR